MKRIVLALTVSALTFVVSGCAVNTAAPSRSPTSHADAAVKIVHRVYQLPHDNESAPDQGSDVVTVDYPERKTVAKPKMEMPPPWLLTTLKVLADLELEALASLH